VKVWNLLTTWVQYFNLTIFYFNQKIIFFQSLDNMTNNGEILKNNCEILGSSSNKGVLYNNINIVSWVRSYKPKINILFYYLNK
jgi:hypothetical protein